MPLPPESRWVRERRSTPRTSTVAVVAAAAILIVAFGMTIGALRVEPRLVPAAGPSAFDVAEDEAWKSARALIASDLVLLRPTWVPSEFRGSGTSACPLPSAFVPGNNYSVAYSGLMPNGTCAYFSLWGQLVPQDDTDLPDGLIETATVSARGTTVHVRSGVRTNASPPPPFSEIDLWWNESGAHYDVLSHGVDLVDLIRVVRSLEPMRSDVRRVR
jgi:hypothetical protein